MSRRVWILAAVAAALAVLTWWPRAEQARPALDLRLPALSAIRSIRITRTGAPPVRLVRDGEWRVEGDPLDPQAHAALQALTEPIGVDASRPFGEGYGLGEHALTVQFDDAPPLRIGKVVDGRRTFIWRADRPERVYRAVANLRAVFDRPPETWRDRRLFDLQYPQVQVIESRGAGAWAARRATPESPWALTAPAGSVGNSEAIAGVVNTLVTAQAARLGGDPPPVDRTLVATTFAGDAHTLELGPPTAAGRAAIVGERVAQLPRHLAAFLELDLAAVREARVFPVAPEEVAEVRVGPLRVRRVDGEWRSGEREVDARPLVAALLRLRSAGEAPVPPGAFAEPHLRVALRTGDDRQLSLTVGAVFNGEARFAEAPGRAPFVLGGESLARLRRAIAAIE